MKWAPALPLILAASAVAADYNLQAKILSYESSRHYRTTAVNDVNTGAVTGLSSQASRTTRVEVEVRGIVYITSCVCFLDTGKTWPAAFKKHHRPLAGDWTTIELQAPDRKGRVKNISLQITGQRSN